MYKLGEEGRGEGRGGIEGGLRLPHGGDIITEMHVAVQRTTASGTGLCCKQPMCRETRSNGTRQQEGL